VNTPTTVPRIAELLAPPSWRTVDFISDLHLQAAEPATFDAWRHYLESTPADAVFILGDLFEAWVGDDAVHEEELNAPSPGFDALCAHAMGQAAGRLALFFMHGNRDFLVGQGLMDLCNTTLLHDPTVLEFPAGSGRRWLLSHGDALCLDDTEYMEFRRQVRGAEWQRAFLAKPLAERQDIARGLRRQSEARKQSGASYADVDTGAARQWLRAANASTLIHGHTHKPAVHDLGDGLSRIVLSDWDLAAPVPRADVLRLTAGGSPQRIGLA